MYWWLLLGLLLLGAALAMRGSTGIGWARVTYTDTRAWQPSPEPLISRRYGLVGKPDYLIKRGRHLIPVEVKPGRRSQTPYDSDQMQLAAYCLLVEDTTGRRPPYGLLRYADTTFRVSFNNQRRDELIDILHDMHTTTADDFIPRSHDQPERCRGCGYANRCEQSLDDE